MNIFNNPLKKSLYTLFSGLFLVAGIHTTTLPIVSSVNRPADTITPVTSAEPKDHLETRSANLATTETTYKSSTPVYYASSNTSSASAQTASAPQGDYIAFSGHVVYLFDSSDTNIDAGALAAYYKSGKFIYGHNTTAVFATLPNLTTGTQVTISKNGTTANYTVAYKQTYSKAYLEQLDQSGINNMTRVAYGQDPETKARYTFAIMTCAGTLYGGGDASHRTIVFLK